MACMQPATGNIYDGETLIGYRDPITDVFTPEGATDWELLFDKWQTQTTCETVPAGFKPAYDTDEQIFVFDTEEQKYLLEEL